MFSTFAVQLLGRIGLDGLQRHRYYAHALGQRRCELLRHHPQCAHIARAQAHPDLVLTLFTLGTLLNFLRIGSLTLLDLKQ